MGKGPYERFEPKELILRDELAIDRTLLANERTLLAYLRSAVAMLITGGTIIHFSVQTWFMVLGMAFIPGALVVAMVGVHRYRRMNRAISTVRRKFTVTAAPAAAANDAAAK
ncbi:MAG: DUF202 domain-containing protein [Phycisphaerae bacterium]|nr:DUF202 domain-containing protein [Phycisphaerae bacterium]